MGVVFLLLYYHTQREKNSQEAGLHDSTLYKSIGVHEIARIILSRFSSNKITTAKPISQKEIYMAAYFEVPHITTFKFMALLENPKQKKRTNEIRKSK